MHKLCIPLFSIFCVSSSALADVPVYRDHTLSISEALVETDSGTSYYSDIKLSANPDGSFELVQAQQLAAAHVDEVTLHVAQTEPVTVSVEISGYLPSPCYQLEEPAVMRDGTTFTIVLAQRPLQTFVACIQIIEPFTVFAPLNIKGLQAGHYSVIVNGKTSRFDLP